MSELTSADTERLREIVEDVWLRRGLERVWDVNAGRPLTLVTSDPLTRLNAALEGRSRIEREIGGGRPFGNLR